MARITVEDCLDYIPNRFEMTLVAAKRAHSLARNRMIALVPEENDKCTVVALREIAAGHTEFKTPIEEEGIAIRRPQPPRINILDTSADEY